MVNLFYKSTQSRQNAYNKQRNKDLINQLKQKEKLRALNEQEEYNEEVANQLSNMYSKFLETNENNKNAILEQLKGKRASPMINESLLRKIGMTTATVSPKVDEIREAEAIEPKYFVGDKVDEIRPAQSTVRRYPMQYKADETRPTEKLRSMYPMQSKQDEIRPATAIAPQTLSTIEETIKKLQDSARADRLLRNQAIRNVYGSDMVYNRGRYTRSRALLVKGKNERGIRKQARDQKNNLIRSNQIQDYASTLQRTRERRQNLARELQNYLSVRAQPQQNAEEFLSASESVIDSLSPRSNRSDMPILEDIDSPRLARTLSEDILNVLDSPELRNAIARANFAKRSVEKKRRELVNRFERAIRNTEKQRDDVLDEMQEIYSPRRNTRQTSPTATTASMTDMTAEAKSPPRGPHLSTMKRELKEWYNMYPQEQRYPSLRPLTTAQVNAEISRLQSKYNLEEKGRGIYKRKKASNRRY